MSKELYFIPIIANALLSQTPDSALQDAFLQIQEMGKELEYVLGYENFLQLQEEAAKAADEVDISEQMVLADSILEGMMAALNAGSFKEDSDMHDTLLDIIRSRLEWQQRYEEFLERTSEGTLYKNCAKVSLHRDSEFLSSIQIPLASGKVFFDGISPGFYSLSLDTGLEIWSGQLGEEHLVWNCAHPEQPLEIAADTDKDSKATPTLVTDMLDNSAQLSVYAGLESGTINIKFRRQ